MRTWKALIFFILVQTLLPIACYAAEPTESISLKRRCIDQINQRSAALVAEDWSALERLAEFYAKSCKDVFDNQDYSTAYEHVAIANVKMNNAKKALAASDMCINITYSNSGCHLQRVEALLKLARRPDAGAALEKAERLISHLISLTERDIKDAPTPLDKEVVESHLNNLNAQKRHAAALRNRYFSQ